MESILIIKGWRNLRCGLMFSIQTQGWRSNWRHLSHEISKLRHSTISEGRLLHSGFAIHVFPQEPLDLLHSREISWRTEIPFIYLPHDLGRSWLRGGCHIFVYQVHLLFTWRNLRVHQLRTYVRTTLYLLWSTHLTHDQKITTTTTISTDTQSRWILRNNSIRHFHCCQIIQTTTKPHVFS